MCHEGYYISTAGLYHYYKFLNTLLPCRRLSLFDICFYIWYVIIPIAEQERLFQSRSQSTQNSNKAMCLTFRQAMSYFPQRKVASQALGSHVGLSGHLPRHPTNSPFHVMLGNQVISCFHLLHATAHLHMSASLPTQHCP